ncbi:MAG: hypothetical protein KA191_17345 [Verrucomicrobia bacterium]|nr:hypothetical protein [Verrucomicrobiota bacterium]OQC65735.1 MAG: hypothetical protein BWX48_02222 [Verrucomicrobia bacterium ADurb.Bin006]MDI9379272.1 DUF6057 family protein [Verrucomicrobiota bacterium]HOA62876.1 DUF6057 family protein [Verrucomicrobiota bacterium]HOF49873.1 DUF6057 family protein [Verrucomicrobiota bacterium]
MGRRKQQQTPDSATAAKQTPPPHPAEALASEASHPTLPTPPHKTSWLPVALLFLAAWLYIELRIDPPLRYYHAGPVFFLNSDFLADHLDRPGGLVEYAAAWLAQTDCRAMLGAFVTASLSALVWGAAALLLKPAGRCHSWLPFVPALLLLALAGRYDAPLHAIAFGLLLALCGAVAWQVWRPVPSGLRWGSFWLAVAALFYVAGPIPSLLFVLLGTLWETALAMKPSLDSDSSCFQAAQHAPRIRNVIRTVREKDQPVPQTERPPALSLPAQPRSGRFTSPVVCGLAVAVIAGGILVFPEMSLATVFTPWGTGLSLVVCALLHVCLPIALGLTVAGIGAPVARGTAASSGERRRRMPHPTRWVWRLAGLAASVALLAASFDWDRKPLIRIAWEAQQSRWERVLEAARSLRRMPDPSAQLAINQALYHTGRLNQDLFAFPQRKGAPLLPSMRQGMAVCVPLSNTLLELGQISLAEHYAHEALENIGQRPHLLWQLARINVLQDRPRAARVFLNRLRLVPFHREKAVRRLEALAADPTLGSEDDIARVRPFLVTRDYADSEIPTEFLLRQLLQSNRRNRMAFEYLMAHYLLNGQSEPLLQTLGALDQHGIWETPRHVEEAMIAHLASKESNQTEIAGRRVSPDTIRRYGEFLAHLDKDSARVADLPERLAAGFGDTFWFYQRFGMTFGAIRPTHTTGRQ